MQAVQTALILIDFQMANAGLLLKPLAFADLVSPARRMAEALRSAGGLVVHTRVLEAEMLQRPADKPLPAGPGSEDGSSLVPQLQPQPGDVVVTKRQWGAFYGTDLDLHLRRHAIRTLIIAGMATEVGVESTVRDAYDRGYALIFLQDAISGASEDTHRMFLDVLFPRMGQVRLTADAVAMLGA